MSYAASLQNCQVNQDILVEKTDDVILEQLKRCNVDIMEQKIALDNNNLKHQEYELHISNLEVLKITPSLGENMKLMARELTKRAFSMEAEEGDIRMFNNDDISGGEGHSENTNDNEQLELDCSSMANSQCHIYMMAVGGVSNYEGVC